MAWGLRQGVPWARKQGGVMTRQSKVSTGETVRARLTAPRSFVQFARQAPDRKRSLRRGNTNACERLNAVLRAELVRRPSYIVGRLPTPSIITDRIRELLGKGMAPLAVLALVNQEGFPVSRTVVYRVADEMGLTLTKGGAMPGGGRPVGSKSKPRAPGQKNKPGAGRPEGSLSSPYRDLALKMIQDAKDQGVRVPSHGDIAARLGVSRQLISKLLKGVKPE